MKAWIACACTLFAFPCSGCDATWMQTCKERIVELVAYRAEAMESAFGDLSAVLPAQVQVRFVKMKDPEYPLLSGGYGYDPERHMLMLAKTFASAKTPNPLRSALYYWPFYQRQDFKEEFPVIAALDEALWGAFLQQAAHARGLTWPHKDCASPEVSKRLPCEMLTTATTRYVRERRDLLFNENRVDRIWPEDFADFRKHVWNPNDPQYRDVQRYGGIMLIRPLINEFGVPRVLAYVAQTPFDILENNVRSSALRYQDRARAALRVSAPDAASAPAPAPLLSQSALDRCAFGEQQQCQTQVSF